MFDETKVDEKEVEVGPFKKKIFCLTGHLGKLFARWGFISGVISLEALFIELFQRLTNINFAKK